MSKTIQEIEQEERQMEIDEAKKLLSVMDKKTALFFCDEISKKLPNINDTPPAYRKKRDNYMQFYMFGVKSVIEKIS